MLVQLATLSEMPDDDARDRALHLLDNYAASLIDRAGKVRAPEADDLVRMLTVLVDGQGVSRRTRGWAGEILRSVPGVRRLVEGEPQHPAGVVDFGPHTTRTRLPPQS
ncbi:hypothetical protein [Streptomyces aureus]|uniref:hypothetical protein n=1 Tax=Streptomyces aureus TaxID=193461 RepID=UPI0036361CC5